jgi:hypothetical protein
LKRPLNLTLPEPISCTSQLVAAEKPLMVLSPLPRMRTFFDRGQHQRDLQRLAMVQQHALGADVQDRRLPAWFDLAQQALFAAHHHRRHRALAQGQVDRTAQFDR